MKRILVVISAILVVFLVISSAIAEVEGILITTNATVRSRASYDGSAVANAKNGQVLTVLSREGQWYAIDLRKSGFNKDGVGYVRDYYVVFNSYNLEVPYDDYGQKRYIQSYNDPWFGLSNGQISSGQLYRVNSENDLWLVIQLPAHEGGSGFIRKIDVDMYDWSLGTPHYPELSGYLNPNPQTEVMAWYRIKHYNYYVRVGIRKEPDKSKEIQMTLHEGDTVYFYFTITNDQGTFAYVYNPNYTNENNKFGWMDVQYFEPAQ